MRGDSLSVRGLGLNFETERRQIISKPGIACSQAL